MKTEEFRECAICHAPISGCNGFVVPGKRGLEAMEKNLPIVGIVREICGKCGVIAFIAPDEIMRKLGLRQD